MFYEIFKSELYRREPTSNDWSVTVPYLLQSFFRTVYCHRKHDVLLPLLVFVFRAINKSMPYFDCGEGTCCVARRMNRLARNMCHEHNINGV